MQANQVDGVIAGMSITEDRKQVFDFSDPYFESGVQMAVLATNNDIKSYEDLRGKRVAVKNGTAGRQVRRLDQGQVRLRRRLLRRLLVDVRRGQTGNSQAVFEDYPVLVYGIAQGNGFKTVTPKEKGPATASRSTRATTPSCSRSSTPA